MRAFPREYAPARDAAVSIPPLSFPFHLPSTRRRAALGIAALLLAAASARDIAGAQLPASADTLRLSITDARALALRANPDLLAARTDIDVARGNLRQAGVLRFNPGLDVLGSGARGTAAEVAATQEIEIAGQRGARRAVARAGVTRAELSVADAARLTITDVDRSFYGAVAAERRSRLANDVLALNERLAQVATRQLAAGEISKLDYNLSVVELGRSRARVLAARRQLQDNLIELHRLLGLSPGTPVAAVFDSTAHHHVAVDSAGTVRELDLSDLGAPTAGGVDDLLTLAVNGRPDLAERGAAVRQAQADVTVARREALPNLVARVQSEQNSAGSGRVLRPGVGISVPLFNRNQGAVDARRAAARGAELERAAAASRVRAEVESAYRAYQAAAGEVEVLERTVLGPARDNLRLLETAYREGKIGLPVLLLVRNQVIDAEQDYWSAWLAERDAESQLRAAVGLPLSISR